MKLINIKTVVGMDPQLDDLYYTWYDNGKLVRIRRLKRRDYKRRIRQAYDIRLPRLFRNMQAFSAILFLEDIYFGINIRTYGVLAKLQGEILYEARKHNVPVVMVPPRKWQKAILGFAKNRNKLEAASKERGKGIAGREVNAHEADAINIGEYGLSRIAESIDEEDLVKTYV
jgi:Holliday junction resolvasome RuvABC endonuclease subunit